MKMIWRRKTEGGQKVRKRMMNEDRSYKRNSHAKQGHLQNNMKTASTVV